MAVECATPVGAHKNCIDDNITPCSYPRRDVQQSAANTRDSGGFRQDALPPAAAPFFGYLTVARPCRESHAKAHHQLAIISAKLFSCFLPGASIANGCFW